MVVLLTKAIGFNAYVIARRRLKTDWPGSEYYVFFERAQSKSRPSFLSAKSLKDSDIVLIGRHGIASRHNKTRKRKNEQQFN